MLKLPKDDFYETERNSILYLASLSKISQSNFIKTNLYVFLLWQIQLNFELLTIFKKHRV